MILVYIFGAIVLIIAIKFKMNIIWIVSVFKYANVLVFGKKRKGKDLLFQAVIKQRNDDYFSTITYGYHHHEITLDDINLDPNTYRDLIDNTITKLPFKLERENKDVYISDGGQYLPSQYHNILEKKYPGIPLYMGLSGHLYDSNVHINYNGAYTRLWDKCREQADDYFRALITVKVGPLIFSKYRYYSEEQAAKANVLPLKKPFLKDKEYRTAKKEFDAQYGLIKEMWICQRISKIKYDTRHFKKVFFYFEEDERDDHNVDVSTNSNDTDVLI